MIFCEKYGGYSISSDELQGSGQRMNKHAVTQDVRSVFRPVAASVVGNPQRSRNCTRSHKGCPPGVTLIEALVAIAIVAALVFFLMGLKRSKNRFLEGQVFVVSKDATNHKMGLVRVKVYCGKETIDAIRRAHERISSYQASSTRYLQNRVSERLAAAQGLQGTIDFNRHLEKRDVVKKYESQQSSAIDEANGFKLEIEKVRANLVPLFFEALPPPTEESLTDADGRFGVAFKGSLPAAVAAQAERHVGGQVEKYYWFVWLDKELIEGTAQLLLSNDKLVNEERSLEAFLPPH